MKLKRLLVLAPDYAPHSGGVENHIRQVVAQLPRLGYQPTILVRYSPELPAAYDVDGVRVVRLPREGNRLQQLGWLAQHASWLRQCDLVHSHDIFPPLIRRVIGRKPWVHTFHGYEGYPLDPTAITSRQRVRAVVPYCIGVGAFIEKWYGTPCDAWIYGGINLEQLPPKRPAQWDIIFYGRLEDDTGFKSYLEAFKPIQEQDPNAHMLVVGNGSLKKWGEQFCQQYDLAVTFKPAHAAVLDDVAASRVCFVSGYLAILEAAALGKPVIALHQTPIKHDYLTCHPMADQFAIVGSAAEAAKAYHSAQRRTERQLAPFQTWARQQTWTRIAELYAEFYQR